MTSEHALSNTDLAIKWLLETPENERPPHLFLHLRRTFELSTPELCRAIDEYQANRAHRQLPVKSADSHNGKITSGLANAGRSPRGASQ